MMREAYQGPGGGAIYHQQRRQQAVAIASTPDAIIIRQSLLESFAAPFRYPELGRHTNHGLAPKAFNKYLCTHNATSLQYGHGRAAQR